MPPEQFAADSPDREHLMHKLFTALASAKGHTQLMQRVIDRDGEVASARLARALAEIDRGVSAATAAARSLLMQDDSADSASGK